MNQEKNLFESNKYTLWYFEIINSAKIKDRKKDILTESHHIIPRCMNGSNDKSNLVRLTHREHYICHLLLCKMISDKKILHRLVNAVYLMQSTRRVTAREYQFLKENSKINKKDHWRYGKKNSEESNRKRSITLKGKLSGSKNPMYGRCGKLNPCSRSVVIDGIEYSSLKEAANIFNVNVDTIKYRIKTKVNYSYKQERNRNIKAAPKKPISIDGIYYESSTDAARILGILAETIRYRLKSDYFTNWYFL